MTVDEAQVHRASLERTLTDVLANSSPTPIPETPCTAVLFSYLTLLK